MKLHAKFPYTVRGQDVEVDISGDMDQAGFAIQVLFSKDGKHIDIPGLTREELAVLCRQAAKVKAQ